MCHVLSSVSSGFQIVPLVIPKRLKLGETVTGLSLGRLQMSQNTGHSVKSYVSVLVLEFSF